MDRHGPAALAMTVGRGLAMTALGGYAMLFQTVIANDVKQCMGRALHRCDVVGFREGAEWIAKGLAALVMTVGMGLAMTALGGYAMLSQTVIANDVKQSMSRALHRRDVVGFGEGAAWIATGLRPSR